MTSPAPIDLQGLVQMVWMAYYGIYYGYQYTAWFIHIVWVYVRDLLGFGPKAMPAWGYVYHLFRHRPFDLFHYDRNVFFGRNLLNFELEQSDKRAAHRAVLEAARLVQRAADAALYLVHVNMIIAQGPDDYGKPESILDTLTGCMLLHFGFLLLVKHLPSYLPSQSAVEKAEEPSRWEHLKVVLCCLYLKYTFTRAVLYLIDGDLMLKVCSSFVLLHDSLNTYLAENRRAWPKYTNNLPSHHVQHLTQWMAILGATVAFVHCVPAEYKECPAAILWTLFLYIFFDRGTGMSCAGWLMQILYDVMERHATLHNEIENFYCNCHAGCYRILGGNPLAEFVRHLLHGTSFVVVFLWDTQLYRFLQYVYTVCQIVGLTPWHFLSSKECWLLLLVFVVVRWLLKRTLRCIQALVGSLCSLCLCGFKWSKHNPQGFTLLKELFFVTLVIIYRDSEMPGFHDFIDANPQLRSLLSQVVTGPRGLLSQVVTDLYTVTMGSHQRFAP